MQEATLILIYVYTYTRERWYKGTSVEMEVGDYYYKLKWNYHILILNHKKYINPQNKLILTWS